MIKLNSSIFNTIREIFEKEINSIKRIEYDNLDSFQTIKTQQRSFIKRLDELFLSEVSKLEKAVVECTNNVIHNLNEFKSYVENFNDEDVIECNSGTDSIQVLKAKLNESFSNSNDVIIYEEMDLFHYGNTYTKSNLLEYINKFKNHIFSIRDKFNYEISNMSEQINNLYDISEDSQEFIDDKIYLYALDDYVYISELSNIQVPAEYKSDMSNKHTSESSINNDKVNSNNKFINLINSSKLMHTVDDHLEFNYNILKEFENTYEVTLSSELKELLATKCTYLNKHTLPCIPTMSVLFDERLDFFKSKGYLPLVSLIDDDVICQSINDESIHVYDNMENEFRNIAINLYSYIKLIISDVI